MSATPQTSASSVASLTAVETDVALTAAVPRPAARRDRGRRGRRAPRAERPRRAPAPLADDGRLRRRRDRRHAPGLGQRVRQPGRAAGDRDPAVARRRRRPRPVPHDRLALGPRRPRRVRLDRRDHRAVGPVGARARMGDRDALRGQDPPARDRLARDRATVFRVRALVRWRARRRPWYWENAIVLGPAEQAERVVRRHPPPAQARHQRHGVCRAGRAVPARDRPGDLGRRACATSARCRSCPTRPELLELIGELDARPRDHRRPAALRPPARPHRAARRPRGARRPRPRLGRARQRAPRGPPARGRPAAQRAVGDGRPARPCT